MGGGLFFHGLLDTHQNLTLSRDTSLLYVDLNTDFFFLSRYSNWIPRANCQALTPLWDSAVHAS